MNRVRLYKTFIILICLPGILLSQTPQEKEVDKLFSELNTETPGAAAVVIKDGKIIYSKGFGSANLEYDIPLTSKTVINIASVSKQFTAFAILLLAEQGKLSLADDIRKHLPELPDYGKEITIRHILTHTSGLRDHIQLLQMAGWKLSDVITREIVFELIKRQNGLNFTPGDKFMYSNSNYILAAMIVERISGRSFAEFCKEFIFAPLKMNSTLFYDDYEKIVKNRADSYYLDGKNYKKFALTFSAFGDGGLLTTVDDLGFWMMNFETAKVGSKRLFSEMNTPANLNDGTEINQALGQIVDSYRGLKQIHHAGGMKGFNSYLARFPDQKFAVAVLSNKYEFSPQNTAYKIADIYLEKDFKEKKKQSEKANNIKLSVSELEKFSGNYWSDDASLARRIYVKDGNLIYSRSAANESILLPISNNEFVMSDAVLDVKFSFKTGKNGKKLMFYHLYNDPPIAFEEYLPVSYSMKELNQFTGRFYSEELGILYSFEMENGKLFIKNIRASNGQLKSVKTDFFAVSDADFTSIEFIRNSKNEIIGCLASGSLAKGILFKKIEL